MELFVAAIGIIDPPAGFALAALLGDGGVRRQRMRTLYADRYAIRVIVILVPARIPPKPGAG
jgi:hypothetical protein